MKCGRIAESCEYLEKRKKECRGIKIDCPEKYGTSFEYQEKETGLLWTCKKASFPTKISVRGQGGWKRGRGRRRKSWTGNVSEMTKMSMAQYSVKALDRSE